MNKTLLSAALLISLLISVSACRNPEIGLNYERYMNKRDFPLYDGGAAFEICHGFGCRLRSTAYIEPEDIQKIKRAYGAPHATPAAEREGMARAVGVIEEIVGAQTGTDADVAGTYTNSGNDQFDCVDESVNTTNAIRLLDMHGLLRYHKLRKPISRTFLSSGRLGPHQTATVMETATTDIYAIDSWFYDNGHAAVVVPIEPWKNGYSPNPDVK